MAGGRYAVCDTFFPWDTVLQLEVFSPRTLSSPGYLNLKLTRRQRLCTYLKSANNVIIELWAAAAANENSRPLHSVSFFRDVSPI